MFHRFIQDTHTESVEEVEETNQQQYQQQYAELDPHFRQRIELQNFVQTLQTEEERKICAYLLNQNITDPSVIKAFIDQIQDQIQTQARQKEAEVINPQVEINRSQRSLENLNALNGENLLNNLSYTLNNEQERNQLLANILGKRELICFVIILS